jgi:hypothetical protein
MTGTVDPKRTIAVAKADLQNLFIRLLLNASAQPRLDAPSFGNAVSLPIHLIKRNKVGLSSRV